MALLAMTKKTIEMMGSNTPIPFSETKVSPDNVSDLYTKTPSNTKFNMMFKRFNTNCIFRLLKLNIETNVNTIEPRISPKTKGSFLSMITSFVSFKIIGNHKYKAPITNTQRIR